MGMYTQLITSIRLVRDVPDEVVHAIQQMLAIPNKAEDVLIDDPLFKTDRWRIMLTCGSVMFPGQLRARFEKCSVVGWQLATMSQFKNYDEEVDKFIDWIAPYVRPGSRSMLMHWYEEDPAPSVHSWYDEDEEE
jgi:hypothetical protein